LLEGPWLSRLRHWIEQASLACDAVVDSTLFAIYAFAQDRYAAYSAFMNRFRVRGWLRALDELACETLTIGVALGIGALALAVPAFRETSEDWLKKTDLAVTFLDRYGQVVGRRGINHDDSVPFDELPPYLIHAVLATEDRRFFDHLGVDVIGTLRALTVNARENSVVQGGSSITQQLAKNLFLSNKRTIERKIKEAYLAVWLEFHLPKPEILHLYLDRAYLGGGAFGVEAAARFYFGKSVRDLTLAESAMIAGLFKAPTKYAPHINLPAARARANIVLSNMVEAGYLSQGQIYAALRNPAKAIDRSRESSPDWYLDYAYDEVKRLAEAGKLGDDRVLTVRTALDTNLQRHADAVIEDQLRQHGPSYKADQSAMVVVEPLGALRAMVGGRDYGASQFNRATDALRQPGSSFKPFVYLTALMTGKFKPSTIVVDSAICIGNWCPHNYKGSFAGRVPLVEALARSLNTVAVRLSVEIGKSDSVPGHNNVFEAAKRGRAKIVETARAMGLSTPLTDTVSLPIGAAEVTVVDMASAYCVFANGGLRAPAYAAVEIASSRGEVIYKHDRDGPQPHRVIEAETIETMDSMLLQVVQAGTGRRAQLDDREVGGKTGTTNGYKDAWFIGFTGNYVGAVWFGNDDDSPMENMTGGSLPAATWHEVMAYAHRGLDPKPLPGRPMPAVAQPGPSGSPSPMAEVATTQRQGGLSVRAVQILREIEAAMKARQEEEQGRGETGAALDDGQATAPGRARRSAPEAGG
jgi:penicillin-binding protein 1A